MVRQKVMAKAKKIQKFFKARMGAPFKNEDAQAIGEYIDTKLTEKTTMEMLDIIKNDKECPLYKYIEWDRDTAAMEFQLQQIRNIVNHVMIEIKSIGENLPVRAFYSVSTVNDEEKSIYVNVETTFDNEYYKKQVINRAKIELRNWAERYRQYNELSSIIDVIDEYFGKGGLT